MAIIVTGATPKHTFKINADLREAEEIWITYKQGRHIRLNKTLSDGIEVEEKSISVKLSQEDTLLFSREQDVKIQIRARFDDGTAIASTVIHTTASECLRQEVI